MTLGERIKHMRRQLGYSQQQLADLACISQMQISRYEQDAAMPTSEVIVNMARALGVSTDWLLGVSDAIGLDGLSELEKQALSLFRSKSPDRQTAVIEILRWA